MISSGETPHQPAHPTIIVVHYKENRKKCTVEPLRQQPGFEFWNYPLKRSADVPGYVRLGLDGPPLSPADQESGLLVLDGTWRWAEKMEEDFAHVPVRSLPPFETAYPRVSKVFDDPSQGLATIEAIYAAYHALGYPVDGLLDQYYWKDKFLELNADLLEGSP
ncbi:MAG: ribosome biogenesis domain-containing protein [Rubinisphaera brasiliensis]|uniref:16S/18S rRNA aminocarboxypropyltransferase Tsr3 C-terminal domain-containing protein n=1 Tax=Rubinisphaera brasiliensis (strain ATCC 49424 / DSM 5305 / JCM 21570 / IAM 15109 / NBRC 103401 / IFAM 1448) TaxID=756272 RepID=F0SL00_RUBBR|nr:MULTISPECIES: DUF367 domain-containing protein [Rubinisphaera]ADY59853.1 hypothetical protein Plabr_2251 [Rubinisphaera brasiliensis DSM 5305]MBB03846.1 DUF367 domain-containing protein [Planctomyces sp.]MBR9802848.1 DUF367 domain-containing protein [bacterium]